MFARTLLIAAIGALATAASPASAGSPCCCAMPCAAPAPVTVYQPYEMPQVYVVDQGPVYSGPGIYTNPTVMYPHPMPAYPYVGYDRPGYLPQYQEPAPLRSRAQAVPTRRTTLRHWHR